MTDISFAPGWPGIAPRWTSSVKTGIGTALNPHSKVWFTVSHGILNEVYFPRVDQACTRDLGLMVTDGAGYFSEEKRHCTFENSPIEPGVPVYNLTNTSRDGRYRIEKQVFSDPYRHVVLQRITLPRAEREADGLSRVRHPCSSSRELRLRQYRVGERLQGHPYDVCETGRCHAGIRLFPTLEKILGWIRRLLRRLAGSFAARPDAVGIHPRTEWKRRADGRN